MANNSKLYVVITDKRPGGNSQSPGGVTRVESEQKENKLNVFVEHEMMHIVKAEASKFVSFTTSNIGNFTGNYIVQEQINSAKESVSGITRVALSARAGLIASGGNPIGAAIGFAAGVLSLVGETVYETYMTDFNTRKTNYDIAQLRERSGLNTYTDMSRGTED